MPCPKFMKNKKCSKCGSFKNGFSFKNRKLNIFHSVCKLCQRTYTKKYYWINRKLSIERVLRRRRRIAKWFRNFKKTLSCVKCGEADWVCLDLHHKNPTEKEHGIGWYVHRGVSIENILKEIKKTKVLCANCHRKFHRKGET